MDLVFAKAATQNKIVLKLAHCALLWLLLIRVLLPQFFFYYTLREGGARARPWISRQGASFQHAYFSPKYPYLLDISFNDSLLQVQHRFYYLLRIFVIVGNTTIYTTSLKNRNPTNENVFDNEYNSKDENGIWNFNSLTTTSLSLPIIGDVLFKESQMNCQQEQISAL